METVQTNKTLAFTQKTKNVVLIHGYETKLNVT